MVSGAGRIGMGAEGREGGKGCELGVPEEYALLEMLTRPLNTSPQVWVHKGKVGDQSNESPGCLTVRSMAEYVGKLPAFGLRPPLLL